MQDSSAQSLMRAVRPGVVLKYVSQLLLLLALITAVPALVALLLDEADVALRYVTVIGVLALVSLPLSRLPEPQQIQRNEALCVTALVFLITPLLMTYPLMASGLSWIDAWFEAVSGVTTTGLSTLPAIEQQPAIFLFARAWMQWYGGLGIAVLAVALFMGHKTTSKKLLESAGEEGQATTARTYARQILQVYLALTVIGFLLLWPFQQDAFLALIHTLAAVSTGGFSGFNDSLASVPPGAQTMLTLLSLAGAITLPLYFIAFRQQPGRLLHDTEVHALLLLTGLTTLLLSACLAGWHQLNWANGLRHAAMLAVSAQSTAGFSSVDVASLAPSAQLILIFSMLIGGCTGSTAGGIKIIRLLILLKLIQLTLQRTAASPRAVLLPKLGKTRLDTDEIAGVLVLSGLWGLVTLLSWLLLLADGQDPLGSLFEVVSAMGTVGLSSGITQPDLSSTLKLVLGADMLLGRLEIIALLVLLYPPSWFGRRRSHS